MTEQRREACILLICMVSILALFSPMPAVVAQGYPGYPGQQWNNQPTWYNNWGYTGLNMMIVNGVPTYGMPMGSGGNWPWYYSYSQNQYTFYH